MSLEMGLEQYKKATPGDCSRRLEVSVKQWDELWAQGQADKSRGKERRTERTVLTSLTGSSFTPHQLWKAKALTALSTWFPGVSMKSPLMLVRK
jgi:hypothetical protein